MGVPLVPRVHSSIKCIPMDVLHPRRLCSGKKIGLFCLNLNLFKSLLQNFAENGLIPEIITSKISLSTFRKLSQC